MDHLLESGKCPTHAQFHGEPDMSVANSDKREDEGKDRLAKLASFQLMMIRHAMKCMRLLPLQQSLGSRRA